MSLNLTLDTWLISDTHFFHTNIVEYCGRPPGHMKLIASNWAEMVGADEDILHLGDVTLVDRRAGAGIVKAMPGNKYAILGNHDRVDDLIEMGFTVLNDVLWFPYKKEWVAISHYPLSSSDTSWNINIHGHIHDKIHSDTWRDYRNISVEQTNYKPIRLGDILEV